MTDKIKQKIEKVLALAARGGTEAEANTAMALALDMLAKHNLTMSDVVKGSIEDEDVIESETKGNMRESWQGFIWSAIANLYFCNAYEKYNNNVIGSSKRSVSYLVVGRKTNVDTVKSVSVYLVSLAKELAKEASTDNAFRRAFKLGFMQRIRTRCHDEYQRAVSKVSLDADSPTNKALTISDLYSKRNEENADYLRSKGVYTQTKKTSIGHRSQEGFNAGATAANNVSLKTGSTLRIGR